MLPLSPARVNLQVKWLAYRILQNKIKKNIFLEKRNREIGIIKKQLK
jgi:hypothetical protein